LTGVLPAVELSYYEHHLRHVSDVFTLAKGPFYGLSQTLPETKENLDGLFFEYYMVRPVSPIVEHLKSTYENEEQFHTQLANMLWTRYHRKWEKLFGIDSLEYVPIDNFSSQYSESTSYADSKSTNKENDSSSGNARVSATQQLDDTTDERISSLAESEQQADSVSKSGVDSEGKSTNTVLSGTESSTRTDALSQSNVSANGSSATTVVDTGVYGENTSELSPTDKVTTQNDSSNGSATVTANTGTHTISGTNGTTTTVGEAGVRSRSDEETSSSNRGKASTQSDSSKLTKESGGTNSSVESGTTQSQETIEEGSAGVHARTSQRSGILGNTSRQKLIREEINLWNWTIVQELLNDVKEFCCLPIW